MLNRKWAEQMSISLRDYGYVFVKDGFFELLIEAQD